MAWLQVNGANRELTDRALVVGSGAQAEWRVQGADLRARHFVVARADDGWSVRTYTTQEVVAVNGRQLGTEPLMLHDGDVIAAGSGWFAFSLERQEPRDLRPPPAAHPHLVNEGTRRAYALHHASSAIGADPTNRVVLRDPGVARFHAEIRRESGGYALHAIDSTGTRLNGRPLSTPLLLREGDSVELAQAVFRFTTSPLPHDVQLAHADEDAETAPGGLGFVKIVSFAKVPASEADALPTPSMLVPAPARTAVVVAALLCLVVIAVAWLAW